MFTITNKSTGKTYPIEDLQSFTSAARTLNTSVQLLRNWCKRGRKGKVLKSYRVDDRQMLLITEVEQFIAETSGDVGSARLQSELDEARKRIAALESAILETINFFDKD